MTAAGARQTGRWRRSLRLNLLLWLIGPVIATLAISLALSYATALRQTTRIMDHQLLASARMIAEQVRYRDGAIRVVVPPAALELFASDSHDEVSYAVIGPSGDLVAGFPGFDTIPGLSGSQTTTVFAGRFRTEVIRGALLSQPVVTPGGTINVSVVVGETLRARDALLRSLWLEGFLEQAALVIAAAVSIWIGISFELRPIMRLRQAVLGRPAGSFAPIDADAVQVEVQPLVAALNDHMARLEAVMRRQRGFLDMAAHQIRTALTVMRTQAGFARRTREVPDMRAALADLDDSLRAMTRMANQLLTLGGIENDRAHPLPQPVDLAGLVQDIAAQIAPRAVDAGIDLAVEVVAPCRVMASDLLLREAVTNLIDNALQHAGRGAAVTVSVAQAEGMGRCRVCDTGPGVNASDREGLFSRFHRGDNARPGGSGLGLAITSEIAAMYGGRAWLPDPDEGPDGGPDEGRGFCVAFDLPLASS
ncbi:MAG: hypothetical protein GC146_03185 [Limimaricola sp.]|uniref:sensor histidine kinase n=1 Tax=Limimaricola sp. TaxID=2211665 RepID=UPI001DBB28D0|nr:sensor histidine kinase [Limimaricola sp.]MBI1416203.1 hypothetical protein [Limimaricola sp.]